MVSDTIAAVATAPGVGALAVVRISGPEAAEVLARVFVPKGRGFPLPSHLMCYGSLRDIDNRLVDEVMCVIMYAPRSYTKEDVAEIHCHGGFNSVINVLDLLYKNGARPAEPGEFTKRAFLNGRIDLSQAEAVMELINAKSDLARRAVLRKLSGGFSNKVKDMRGRILTWLAHIELSVDYPEHEEEAMNLAMVAENGIALVEEIKSLRATARLGERLKTGVPTVIVGKPNVGKSSLMNAILQEERAIVTDIPGTTRDTLTESVNMRNVPILLTDTAGIREGADEAERLGVERSVEQAKSAELVLHVIDRSAPITDEDYAVADLTEGQKKIIVFNKCDLKPWSTCPLTSDSSHAAEFMGSEEFVDICKPIFLKNPDNVGVVEVSAITGQGLDLLYSVVEEMFFGGLISAEGDIITQSRHCYLLDGAVKHLESALCDIKNGVPEDIVSIDLKTAYVLLGELIGEAVGDDVLDRIFAEFCVGK